MNMNKCSHAALSAIAAMVIAAFTATAQQMETPTVSAATVTSGKAVESRRFTGLLQSPSRVSLVVRVSGELKEVGFKDGDMISAGQMLYRLDDVRYDAAVKQAEATVKQAGAQMARCAASLEYSESNYNRVKALYDKNVTTKDALEAALMTYTSDKASLAAAEAAEVAAKAALITAHDDLNNTRVTAPIAGKIGINNFTVGNYLTPASGVLATLVQLDPIRLSFSMSNRDFLTLFGSSQAFIDNADVTISLADGSAYPEKAAFEFFDNEGNRSTDTRQIYMLIPNSGLELLPNSTVAVNLLVNTGKEECIVPPASLVNSANGSYVYVIDDQGIANRRTVVPGTYDGKQQFIKSGLKAGERVVVEGTHKVIPGHEVKIGE